MASPANRALCVQLLPDTVAAGAENQARHLIAGLQARRELDIELAYFNAGSAHESFADLGVPLRHAPRSRRLGALGSARRLRQIYAGRSPDLIHTWLLEGNIAGLLAARAWPRTAVVISQRGSWNELEYRMHVRAERMLLGRADHAISNSDGGAQMLRELGLDASKISVVPNGIPAERVRVRDGRAAVRARHDWGEREVVAWVGRDNEPAALRQKDVATLLETIRVLREHRPEAVFVLIGPTREGLAGAGFALADEVVALGWIDAVADYLNAADALVISSRIEGNSNVAGEALMLGLPVASTECGSHCDAVRAANGSVVGVGDAGALAGALANLLERPPERGAVMATARDLLSVNRMADRTLAIYNGLLQGKRHLARTAD